MLYLKCLELSKRIPNKLQDSINLLFPEHTLLLQGVDEIIRIARRLHKHILSDGTKTVYSRK